MAPDSAFSHLMKWLGGHGWGLSIALSGWTSKGKTKGKEERPASQISTSMLLLPMIRLKPLCRLQALYYQPQCPHPRAAAPFLVLHLPASEAPAVLTLFLVLGQPSTFSPQGLCTGCSFS